MNVLLIGSGGREHALAWKLAQSPLLDKLFLAPGNAGTTALGENLPISGSDFEAIAKAVAEKNIGLVIVGPEQPLVEGIVDFLEEKGVAVLGPSKLAAQLEGSKAFSKAFMERQLIPTAAYAAFQAGQLAEALAYVHALPTPIVVKASGLAAGKGVSICATHEDAAQTVAAMLSGEAFGEAGTEVVIEEFLTGIEISVFVLSDGKDYVILPPAKDYKRIGEGDTGPNTGGMGSVSPVWFADEAFMEDVRVRIVEPSLHGMIAEGMPFKGFLFIGLMVRDGVPYVLEYNVRMGDPETQSVMPRIVGDFLDLCHGAATHSLAGKSFETAPWASAGVVLVSGGYPEAYEKGKVISGIDQVTATQVFHAGTKVKGDDLVTDGGRVLFVSGQGATIEEAIAKALADAEKIDFEGKFYRKDIGRDVMRS